MLITGGTGQLGAALLARRAGTGEARLHATWWRHEPSRAEVVGDGPPGSGAAAVTWHRAECGELDALVVELRPELVIHTAYVPGGDRLWPATAEAPGRVAAACARVGARLVHLSTDVVLDGELAAGERYPDDAPRAPITDYGRAKAYAEEAVAAEHPRALIVRTSLIHGGAADPNLAMVRGALSAGEHVGGPPRPITFFVDELRCPIHVDDLAAAVVELAATAERGVWNVAGADVVSRYDFAVLLTRWAGLDPSALASGRSADQPVRRPRNCALDSSRAQARLATRLRGCREVLA